LKALRGLLGRKAADTAAMEREASIPYAPAIALGVWLSLVPKG
jgi:prepilin signal peptidase PulO-like enzyme (type II secretory pathway)